MYQFINHHRIVLWYCCNGNFLCDSNILIDSICWWGPYWGWKPQIKWLNWVWVRFCFHDQQSTVTLYFQKCKISSQLGGGGCCYKIRMLQSYRAQKSMAVGHRRWNRPNSNLYHLIDLINNFVILVDSSQALLSPQFVITTGMWLTLFFFWIWHTEITIGMLCLLLWLRTVWIHARPPNQSPCLHSLQH